MRRGIEIDRKEIDTLEDSIDREKMNPEANKIIAKLAQNKQRPNSLQTNELSNSSGVSTRVMSNSVPSSMQQRLMSTRSFGKIDEDEDSSDEEETIGGNPLPANNNPLQESTDTNVLSASTASSSATLNPDIIRPSARTASIMSETKTNLPANAEGCCTIF